jgi:NifU-like protein involved in Fe-S cluster formation
VNDSALYNRDILRLASSLVAGDRLENPDGSAESRSPICGSRIQADVALAADGTVAALALRANACALGQASAAILRANAVGVNLIILSELRSAVAEGLSGKADMPTIWPELALLAPAKDYPSRHAAILLPYDALLAATQNLKMAS